MTNTARLRAALLVAVLLAAGFAMADDRFPRPEFENGHQAPTNAIPAPASNFLDTFDVVLLALALLLAAHFSLRSRSRRGLFGLSLFSLAYFGFFREGCVCPIGSIQNVAAGLANPSYLVPATTVAFFVLPLAAALAFGRTFCGGVCPLGAIQDVVMLRPMTLPRWLGQVLSVGPHLYLGLGVLFAATGAVFLICRFDPFVSFFRLTGSSGMLMYSGGFLALAVVIARPYCRFLCPYGVLLGWMSRLSWRQLRTNPDGCITCRLCEQACPMGCIDDPTSGEVKEDRQVARRRLGIFLALIPVAVGLTAWLGTELDATLATMHPTIRLANRVRAEERGVVTGTTLESRTFRGSGQPVEELYEVEAALMSRFHLGGGLLGAYLGLVIMLKLISLSVYRTREEYQPDPATCFSCGRCFSYCPQDQPRSGNLPVIQVGSTS